MMSWLNAIAWAGIATILVPMLVHFFTRTRARSLPFPSLRFLPRTRLVPTWSRRPSDLLLMMVRVLVLLFAVAALARPVISTDASGSSSTSRARFVLVDTSWSVHGGDSSSLRAVESMAEILADSATISRVGLTANPRAALAGAAAWLERVDVANAEVVVLSDFQRASIDSSDLAVIPSTLGVRLVRVPDGALRDSAESTVQIRRNGGLANVSFDASDAGTTVRYSKSADSASVIDVPIEFTGVTAEEEAALRSIGSSNRVVLPMSTPSSTEPAVVVHLPGDPNSAQLKARLSLASSRSLRAVVALATDETIKELARSAPALRLPEDAAVTLQAIAHNNEGAVLVEVGSEGDSSSSKLHVFVNASPQSAFAAAVVAALTSSAYGGIALSEFDHAQLSNVSLEVLQRPAPERGKVSNGLELAPVLWLLALVALLAEMLLRNRRSAAPAEGTNSVSAAA